MGTKKYGKESPLLFQGGAGGGCNTLSKVKLRGNNLLTLINHPIP